MMQRPRVTVLMSAYNAENFVAEAVDSVLKQTFDNFEFLIFDDCSSDRTLEILKSYQDTRIKITANEVNLGLTRNLIQGMKMACGQYVARMDADDICMPSRLERQLDYFTKHPEISVLGTAVTFFDDNGWEFIAYQPEHNEEIKVTLLLEFTMLHPSVMMRKADMDSYDLNYDASFIYSQDHDLWTRAIRKLQFANLHEALLKMREHGGKIGSNCKPKQEKLSSMVRQRQLDELEVAYTPDEIRVFNMVGSGSHPLTKNEIQKYEAILLKIFSQNRHKHLFDQSILQSIAARHFRGMCCRALKNGKKIGRYYWQTPIRQYDNITLNQKARMLFRSFCLFLHKN